MARMTRVLFDEHIRELGTKLGRSILGLAWVDGVPFTIEEDAAAESGVSA